MDDQCRILREAIERVRAGRLRWRCPPGLRSEVVAFARERHSRGVSVAKIARDLDLSVNGLSRWLRSVDKELESAQRGFREVRIQPEPSSAGVLVLVTPRGFRLEGLSENQALRMLREL